ncbi:MAG: hypothetical protein EOO22_15480, partial [Comamonadaceae bacterium]
MNASLFSPRLAARAVLAAACIALCAPAHAFDDEGIGVYVEGGRAAHGGTGSTDAATVGAMLPWSKEQSVRRGIGAARAA